MIEVVAVLCFFLRGWGGGAREGRSCCASWCVCSSTVDIGRPERLSSAFYLLLSLLAIIVIVTYSSSIATREYICYNYCCLILFVDITDINIFGDPTASVRGMYGNERPAHHALPGKTVIQLSIDLYSTRGGVGLHSREIPAFWEGTVKIRLLAGGNFPIIPNPLYGGCKPHVKTVSAENAQNKLDLPVGATSDTSPLSINPGD